MRRASAPRKCVVSNVRVSIRGAGLELDYTIEQVPETRSQLYLRIVEGFVHVLDISTPEGNADLQHVGHAMIHDGMHQMRAALVSMPEEALHGFEQCLQAERRRRANFS